MNHRTCVGQLIVKSVFCVTKNPPRNGIENIFPFKADTNANYGILSSLGENINDKKLCVYVKPFPRYFHDAHNDAINK